MVGSSLSGQGRHIGLPLRVFVPAALIPDRVGHDGLVEWWGNFGGARLAPAREGGGWGSEVVVFVVRRG